MKKRNKILIVIGSLCLVLLATMYYIYCSSIISVPNKKNYDKYSKYLNEVIRVLSENDNIIGINSNHISFSSGDSIKYCYKNNLYNNYIKSYDICDLKYDSHFELIEKIPFDNISKGHMCENPCYSFQSKNLYAMALERMYQYKQGGFKDLNISIKTGGNIYIGNDGEYYYHQAKGNMIKKILNDDWAIYMYY